MVAVEGETVSILCSTQSNPDPILTIFKEKQILATVIYESQLQLELPAVTPEDDGEYWCVAENQYGQTATAFNLSVECECPSPTASTIGLSGDTWVIGRPPCIPVRACFACPCSLMRMGNSREAEPMLTASWE